MLFNINHVAIDIECLAYAEDAIVTSFSATVFNFEEDNKLTYEDVVNKTFYVKLDIKDQLHNYGRSTDKKTIAWWKSKSQEIRDMSITPRLDDVSLKDWAKMFSKFLDESNYDFRNSYVWSRGIAYDIPKVESMFKSLIDRNEVITKPLLNSWRARDIRTFDDLVGDTHNGKWELPEGIPKSFIEHHAQHDVALDVYKMLRLYHME